MIQTAHRFTPSAVGPFRSHVGDADHHIGLRFDILRRRQRILIGEGLNHDLRVEPADFASHSIDEVEHRARLAAVTRRQRFAAGTTAIVGIIVLRQIVDGIIRGARCFAVGFFPVRLDMPDHAGGDQFPDFGMGKTHLAGTKSIDRLLAAAAGIQ
ncbi:hypothetical protein SDC9_133889 [bioreactor metagenome]|uniref:Uncharacterized protein n=1 Tax=bioreactor metagenome TaxID=1076179 RepID=A0A645DC71_9ZZZZ